MGESILAEKSFKFAIRIVNVYRYLCLEKNEYVLSKQLERSGTAIGALVSEGAFAGSKSDFVHKYAIAQKECNETIYWINYYTPPDSFPKKNLIVFLSMQSN